MSKRPLVSVVVCSRNRAPKLARMLESASAMQVPPDLVWELVIVDNGSTDDTAATVARFADRLPVRRVEEPVPGIGSARNRGVAAARGDYLCWTDDDVVIDPGWLAAYVEAFARHPEAAVFGGRILPRLEAPVTPWFARQLEAWPLNCVTALRDFGKVPVPFDPATGVVPWGGNYAVRAAEQRRFGYPTMLEMCEETHVVHQILRRGGRGWWVPGSTVSHFITSERQNRSYVFDYFRRVTRATARLERIDPGATAIAAARRRQWWHCSTAELRLLRVASEVLSRGAALLSLEAASLRWLARSGLIAGWLEARVEEAKRPQPATRPVKESEWLPRAS